MRRVAREEAGKEWGGGETKTVLLATRREVAPASKKRGKEIVNHGGEPRTERVSVDDTRFLNSFLVGSISSVLQRISAPARTLSPMSRRDEGGGARRGVDEASQGGAAAAAMRMLGFGMVLWTVPLKRCGANAIDPLKDSTFQNYFSHEIDVGRKRVTILGTLWGIKIYP